MPNLIFRVFKTFLLTDVRNSGRFYSRNALRRTPIRILNTPSDTDIVPPIREEGFSSKQLVNVSQTESKTILSQPLPEKLIVPPYDKLQKNDARFTKIVGMIKNRQRREKCGKILLEGKRLINDAVEAGMEMKTLYFSREKDLAAIKLKDPEKVELCKVFYKTLQTWSGLTTCPGVMGIFQRPDAQDLRVMCDPVLPVTILCDNIRDPGNLGSIIRNAAAAGCEHILLMKGCVDPWELKVLRTACGGHFRIPIINNIEWTHISNYLPKESTIFVANNSADLDECNYTADSINFCEVEEESNEDTRYVSFNENNQPISVDETYDINTEMEKYKDITLPCHLYSAISYPKQHIVLYVGGETHGVDPKAIKLACEYGGKQIRVPLENGVESLNSSFAMTIILYEMKRQLAEVYETK